MNKKVLVLLMLLFVSGLSCGNDKMIIVGNVQIDRDFEVVLSIIGDDLKHQVIATTKSIGGKFRFEMEPFEKPTMAGLSFLGSVRGIIIEKGDVTYDYSHTEGSLVKGGFYNDLLYSWESSPRVKEIFQSLGNADRNSSNALRREMQKIQEEHMKGLLGHSDPYVKLFAFLELRGRTDDGMTLLDELQKEFPDNNEIKAFINMRESSRKIAEAAKKVAVGNKLIDFSAAAIDGKSVKFSEHVYKNKYTLLEIWASWCAPCRKAMKTFPPLYAKFQDSGFEIFAISVDEDKSKWEVASKEIKMPWIDVHNIFGGQNDVGELYGITSIPKNILFDSSGTIVALDVSADFLDKFLTEKVIK